MPSLTAEIWRNGRAAREVFQRHLRELVEIVAQQMSCTAPDRSSAMPAIALSVGGLMLAGAVTDTTFSDEILEACRTALTNTLRGSDEPRCKCSVFLA